MKLRLNWLVNRCSHEHEEIALLRILEEIARWLDRKFSVVLIAAIPTLVLVYLFCGESGRFLTYVVGGAAVIWLTNRRATAMEDNVALARKGQAVARFESAVKLLESRSSAIIVGAVYALDRMAREEKEYKAPVFDVLCELIREDEEEHLESARKIAVRVIFARTNEGDAMAYPFPGRLMGARLSSWDLSGLDFSRAELASADLSHANLQDSVLRGANLSKASIYGLKVNSKTSMREVILRGVEVSSGDFKGIDFSGADMRRDGGVVTQFDFVNFIECDFEKARLDGTEFRNVKFDNCRNLTEEQLLRVGLLSKVEGLGSAMESALREKKAELFREESDG